MREALHDIELGYADIQALSDADAVAAFFERLGYNTSVRRIQTPANLGITADSTLRSIKKIELLADQEGLLQIYLFELLSLLKIPSEPLIWAIPRIAIELMP